MKQNKTAESFVGIIIGVFLLSIVVLGLGSLLGYSGDIIDEYENSMRVTFLKSSTQNIIKNIDTSGVEENEIFYIWKDSVTQNYTWTGSESARYIDEFGNHITDIGSFDGFIYSRQLWVEREDTSVGEQNQVIRASIKRLIKNS